MSGQTRKKQFMPSFFSHGRDFYYSNTTHQKMSMLSLSRGNRIRVITSSLHVAVISDHITDQPHDGYSWKETENGIKITSKNTGNRLQSGAQQLWRQGSLCDIVIVSNGQHIPAHRLILAISSDYFRAMFTSGLQEAKQDTPQVTLDEVASEVVQSTVQFMYTGGLSVTKDTVQDFIVISDLLQMQELKNVCCHFMESQVDITNCLGVWDFAEQYSCSNLKEMAVTLAKRQFPVVSNMEEFVSLRPEKLITILQCQDLNTGPGGEDAVLNSISKWMMVNMEHGTDIFADILKHVRLKLVSKEVLDNFLMSSLVHENPELQKTAEHCLNSIDEQFHREAERHIFVIGGYLQSRTGPLCPRLRSTEMYNASVDQWKSPASMMLTSILPSATYAFVLFGKLICIAIEINNTDKLINQQSGGIYELDFIHEKWRDITTYFQSDIVDILHNCLIKAGSITVCEQTNSLYTVTNSTVKCLSFELLNGELNIHKVQDLKEIEGEEFENHANHVATVFKEDLYILGGDKKISQTEIFPSSTVLRYNRETSSWEQKCSMIESRARFDAAVLGEYIYAVGGFNTRRLRTAERYNTVTDQWTYIASMDKERSHLKLVVHQHHIYALGGKSYSFRLGGARKVLNSCEVYDPEEDKWTYVKAMSQARCMFAAVST